MKEKIMLMFGVLFVAGWVFVLAVTSRPQQYDYNGGILKQVYAAVAPDTNNVYTSNPKWTRSIERIIVNVSPDQVNSTPIENIYVPPPPRDSH